MKDNVANGVHGMNREMLEITFHASVVQVVDFIPCLNSSLVFYKNLSYPYR